MKSNREAAGEMGGNVLDMAMAKRPWKITHAVQFDGEPTERIFPEASARITFTPDVADARWTRDANNKAVCRKNHVLGMMVYGERVEVAVCEGDTATVVAQAVAAQIPGATVNGSTVTFSPPVPRSGTSGAAEDARRRCFDAMTSVPTQPAPAPGQVWLPPESACPKGWTYPDGTLTVAEVDGRTVRFRDSACADAEYMTAEREWRCIGVETPHGRVMIGDEFRGESSTPFTIAGIVDGDRVVRRWQDGSEDRYVRASRLLADDCPYRRICYAPARKRERYASRWTPGRVARIEQSCDGGRRWITTTDGHGRTGPTLSLPADGRMRADQWERLDPGRAERAPTLGEAFREGAAAVREAARHMAKLMPQGKQGACEVKRTSSPPLATPGGIPTAAPEPTEEQRVASAILERRCLDMGTPRREGEDDATLTARLDAAELDRLLARTVAKGRPWLVGVAYAREGHTVTLSDARAFTAALDALGSTQDVDAAVETFRRARMATGPTWLRPALERAARELTGTTAERHEQAAPRVQRTRWADPCAWADAVNYWERETR